MRTGETAVPGIGPTALGKSGEILGNVASRPRMAFGHLIISE